MSRFTHAIVCRIPNNVQLDSQTANSGIDLAKARKEQENLCEILREAGVDVIELAPEESAPASSLFVEDLAIVCNGTALITRPSHPSRRKEVAALLMELGLQVHEMEAENKKVMLEGADVLFTGREFFVGLTKWTNLGGAMEVARVFPEFPVTPIKVNGAGHLKRYVALATPNVLAVGGSKEAQNILKRLEREATFRYQTLTLSGDEAVNSLCVNGTLIYRADLGDDVEKFRSLQDSQTAPVDLAQLSKLGGMLSQHCILFRRIKLLKKL